MTPKENKPEQMTAKPQWLQIIQILGISIGSVFAGKSYYVADDSNVKIEVMNQRIMELQSHTDKNEVDIIRYEDKNDKEHSEMRKSISEFQYQYVFRQGNRTQTP